MLIDLQIFLCDPLGMKKAASRSEKRSEVISVDQLIEISDLLVNMGKDFRMVYERAESLGLSELEVKSVKTLNLGIENVHTGMKRCREAVDEIALRTALSPLVGGRQSAAGETADRGADLEGSKRTSIPDIPGVQSASEADAANENRREGVERAVKKASTKRKAATPKTTKRKKASG
ncbi:hypothetical protein [Crateriforma conspicua]|uniref:Uncharacterized protein n=1 Tax=Crateriforma conspicua TaxID=2527996 RepID=A0A5C5XRY0_9PLAN|nr:hypothetical protein [Crateriforma conspicua]TWT65654.1 hypothetical protein Pan14r_52020 [Crateriforma conspicua]